MTDDGTSVLVEIELIKQLKARYCRLLDTKDWAGRLRVDIFNGLASIYMSDRINKLLMKAARHAVG